MIYRNTVRHYTLKSGSLLYMSSAKEHAMCSGVFLHGLLANRFEIQQ